MSGSYILKNKSVDSSLLEELGCSSKGIAVCGRVALERQKSAQLEEELSKTRKEKEEMRLDFETLLTLLNRSLQLDFVIETLKQRMTEIPEIKSVYCLKKKNTLSFSVYMEDENWEIEDKIYEFYSSLIENFSEIDIKIKILRLWGRTENEVMAIGGFKLLG